MKRNYLSILPTSVLANIVRLGEERVRKALRTMPEFQEAFLVDERDSARLASQAKLLLEPESGDKHLLAVNKWVRSQAYMLTINFAHTVSRSNLVEKTTASADAAIATAKSLDPDCIVGKKYEFTCHIFNYEYNMSQQQLENGEDYVKCVSVRFGPYVCLLEFELQYHDEESGDNDAGLHMWSTHLDVYCLNSPWCFAARLESVYQDNRGEMSYEMNSCLHQVGNTPLLALEDRVRMTAMALAACIGRWGPVSYLQLKCNDTRDIDCPLLLEHVVRGLHYAGVDVEYIRVNNIPFAGSSTYNHRAIIILESFRRLK